MAAGHVATSAANRASDFVNSVARGRDANRRLKIVQFRFDSFRFVSFRSVNVSWRAARSVSCNFPIEAVYREMA